MSRRTLGSVIVATIVVLATTAASPAWADTPPCPAGTDRLSEIRLFFGRGQGGVEVVTEKAWRTFLAEEITPRFPDGLTVLDAAGQWRGASGSIERERTKLVVILADAEGSGMRLADEIMEAYKRAFDQESVLRTITPSCASF